jgi:hypothetical protein
VLYCLSCHSRGVGADGSMSRPTHLRPDDPGLEILGVFSQIRKGLLGMRFPKSGTEGLDAEAGKSWDLDL